MRIAGDEVLEVVVAVERAPVLCKGDEEQLLASQSLEVLLHRLLWHFLLRVLVGVEGLLEASDVCDVLSVGQVAVDEDSGNRFVLGVKLGDALRLVVEFFESGVGPPVNQSSCECDKDGIIYLQNDNSTQIEK